MKIKDLVIILVSVLLMSACQTQIDVKTEKAAIIEVINGETEAYLNYDYDKVISFFVHDSLSFRQCAGADNIDFQDGWDQIEAFFKEDLLEDDSEAMPDTRIKVTKDNYQIKVYDNSAYVICTEKWTYTTADNVLEIDSRQVRFMEKIDGEWKIAFLSFIGTSGYEEEEELEALGVEFNSVR